MTPVAASIETQKPVASLPFRAGTMSGSSSSSQRSSGSERQIRPRAWHAMNVIGLGRHELGGHAQIALVLAVGIVADDDHPTGLKLPERTFERCRHFGNGAHGREMIAQAILQTASIAAGAHPGVHARFARPSV